MSDNAMSHDLAQNTLWLNADESTLEWIVLSNGQTLDSGTVHQLENGRIDHLEGLCDEVRPTRLIGSIVGSAAWQERVKHSRLACPVKWLLPSLGFNAMKRVYPQGVIYVGAQWFRNGATDLEYSSSINDVRRALYETTHAVKALVEREPSQFNGVWGINTAGAVEAGIDQLMMDALWIWLEKQRMPFSGHTSSNSGELPVFTVVGPWGARMKALCSNSKQRGLQYDQRGWFRILMETVGG
jgi:hypothetical protein